MAMPTISLGRLPQLPKLSLRPLHVPPRFSATGGAVATSTVLAVASTGLVALAITSNGYAAAKLDIHDGGVWVTNRSNSSVGEVNPVIRQTVMAAYVEPAVPDIEMVQDGSFVVVVTGGDKPILRRVDTTSAVFAPQSTPLPSATVAAGGGRLAVLDGMDGQALGRRPVGPAELHFDESVEPPWPRWAQAQPWPSRRRRTGVRRLTLARRTAHDSRPGRAGRSLGHRARRRRHAVGGALDALRGARNVQVSAVGEHPGAAARSCTRAGPRERSCRPARAGREGAPAAAQLGRRARRWWPPRATSTGCR